MNHPTVPPVHAFTDDVLGNGDAVEIALRIRRGNITAIEAIQAAINRANAVDPHLAAIAIEDFERARNTQIPDGSAAFAGVPTFVKDMTDVAGLPTRFGCATLNNRAPARKTHKIAQQLFDMGMVSIGKSTMPEFGFTPSTEFPDAPPTRNPWNPNHSAGGSSGGAASLVAAGVVPIANAADGGGSIRIPAAACGLVGLKPTRGRISPAQSAEPFVGLVTDGVVTRSVRDTALFYTENEKLYQSRKLPGIGPVDRPLERSLRIGVVTKSPTGAELDSVTRRELDSCVRLLENLGHKVEPYDLELDDQFTEDFISFWSALAFLVAATSRWTLGPEFDRSKLADVTQGLARQGKSRLWRLPGAIRRLRNSHQQYSEQFTSMDVMLCPVVGQLTPEIGHLGMDLPFDTLFPRVEQWACFTPYANATGGPVISLPVGFDEPSNLPVGMMFSADTGQDRLLLELGLQLEEAAPWKTIQQPRT